MGSSVCVSNFIWLLTGPNNQLIVEHFCFCHCLELHRIGLFVRLCVCKCLYICMVCV